jgi:hypothetical protein
LEGSQIHRSAAVLDIDDIKGLPGIDSSGTVTTEITAGGLNVPKHDTVGASPKARKLLGWFRRASIDDPRRTSVIEEEDLGLNSMSPDGAGHSEVTNTGIMVQYDVSRTVEEVRTDISSHEGSSIDLSDPRKEDVV